MSICISAQGGFGLTRPLNPIVDYPMYLSFRVRRRCWTRRRWESETYQCTQHPPF